MKSAKAPSGDASSHRRSQPVRQTRTNAPRSSVNLARSGSGRDSIGVGSLNDPSIDIFPAITHFADAIAAVPKELVRHFTLLKEVDAKIFAPEEQLFRLVAAAANAPPPDSSVSNEASSSTAPASAPMSTQNSSSGITMNNSLQSVPTVDEVHNSSVFDPANLPRRHLFRQTAIKIQEMLVSLEEKNHVISTANEALEAQLARIEDVWPYLESEFSEEAKWGSNTHWAYPQNRTGKTSHAERARRDGAAAISAAAQALAEEAAARSDARKQAVQAKKNSKNQNNHTHHDSDLDDHDGRHKNETTKKGAGSKSRKTVENNVGLGISTTPTTSNGNPPQKRRKVEKTPSAPVPTPAPVPTERAMSTVFGNAAAPPKAKTSSPHETPAPEAPPKKRKALPSSSGQSKKSKNGVTGMSTSAASSPVLTALPEPKVPSRQSPAPSAAPRPASSRARQNSLQSAAAEAAKTRPSSSASNKPNGNAPATPDLAATVTAPPPATAAAPASKPVRPALEVKVVKEASVPVKVEPTKKDAERRESISAPTSASTKKETKPEEQERKSESVPPAPPSAPVTTKSGRASKPSTPALATFQEAAARPRSSRNAEGATVPKKSQKKSNPAIQTLVTQAADEDTNGSMQGDDEEPEIDADEPTYCYCNSVSYGEMVACDSSDCPREWFHLECVGLKVAPSSKTKWFCEDCKERLKMGSKKVNGR